MGRPRSVPLAPSLVVDNTRSQGMKIRWRAAAGMPSPRSGTCRIRTSWEMVQSPFETRAAEQREASGFFDLDVEKLAGEAGGVAVENDDFVMRGAAAEAGGVVF